MRKSTTGFDKNSPMAILTATTDVKNHPNFTAENLDAEPFCVFSESRLKGGVSVFTGMSEFHSFPRTQNGRNSERLTL